MTKRGVLWVAVDVGLLEPGWNRHGINDAAILAYLRLLAWAKRHRTDGLIPFSVAPTILNGCASDLEAAGLIATDHDDHVIVLDWHKWHEPVDELEARRAAERERKRAKRHGYVFKSFSSPSEKERREEKGNRPHERTDKRTDVRSDVQADTAVTWNVTCRHGAPYNGRGCYECRTSKDLG